MKAVLLAGGTGTRLFPLTKVVNKQLLLVGKLPMIVHGIEKLKDAGLVDILIITGVSSAGLLIQLLGSGRAWDVSLTYRIQEEAGGIAHALALAEGYAGSGERFALMLGDNLFENSLKGHVQNFFLKQREGARVLLKEVPDLPVTVYPNSRGTGSCALTKKNPLTPSQITVLRDSTSMTGTYSGSLKASGLPPGGNWKSPT